MPRDARDLAFQARQRMLAGLVQWGGRPLSGRALEYIRDAASYALGAGTAAFPLERNGELRLVAELADRWQHREHLHILDVGANRGDWALGAGAALGPRARIDCYEPNPSTFALLSATIAAEPSIRAHQLAFGDAPGEVSLFSPGDGSPIASLYSDNATSDAAPPPVEHRVEIDTLDRAFAPGTRIDLLKVDVEGHELSVLRGARRLIEERAFEVVQFEFGERNLPFRTFLRDFVEVLAGYRLYRVLPRGLVALHYRPANETFLDETNFAAFRDGPPAR